jgi:hypothetical protein
VPLSSLDLGQIRAASAQFGQIWPAPDFLL